MGMSVNSEQVILRFQRGTQPDPRWAVHTFLRKSIPLSAFKIQLQPVARTQSPYFPIPGEQMGGCNFVSGSLPAFWVTWREMFTWLLPQSGHRTGSILSVRTEGVIAERITLRLLSLSEGILPVCSTTPSSQETKLVLSPHSVDHSQSSLPAV